ncbi:MAG: DNA topoisomerase VI [Candidatus Brocadiia bacterium]
MAKKKRTRRKKPTKATKSRAAAKTAAARDDGHQPVGRMVEVAQEIHGDIMGMKKPHMSFPVRSLSNVRYDPKGGTFKIKGRTSRRDFSYATVRTFAQSLRMLALSKAVVETDDIINKREAYYRSKSWGEAAFHEQPESDTVMDDLEALLGFNREQIGFIPDEHGGSVAGRLTVIDRDPATGEEVEIDCTRFGTGAYSVPPEVEHLEFQTRAKFILVVETTAMFQRLVKHAFWDTADCVLIAMGGVPTRACRRFIRRLADTRRMPVYAFTDGDPYGYANIYRTLKVGSGNAAHLNEFFCVPKASFIGVTPQDITDYNLPTQPLKEIDIKRAKDALKNDPFFKHHKRWQKAIRQMLKMKVRVEQQAFAAHSLNFVLETYLPQKLRSPKKFLP